MPVFTYTAKPLPFQTVQGVIETETEQDAFNRLQQLGYFPVSIRPAEPEAHRPRFLRQAVSRREVAHFTAKLSNLISSGVDILKALNLISAQTRNGYLRSALQEIIRQIKDGKPLSESMAGYPRVFSGLYTALVHSGEISGSLEQTLQRLADFLEKEEEFKGSISAALMYPAFVFCVSCLTVAVLVGFVIPKLALMFEDIGQALPLPTRIMLVVSGALRQYWWLMCLAVVALGMALRRVYRTEAARAYLDRLRLRIFFFGPLALKTEIGRFTRTLSLLMSGGIAIIQALEISRGVLANQVLKDEVSWCREQVSTGSSLSHCLKQSEMFSGLTADVIIIGEETGTLEKALARIAEDCEKDTEQSLKTFSRMLEPVMILVMGAVVGFIVLSMLLPVFQINLAVK